MEAERGTSTPAHSSKLMNHNQNVWESFVLDGAVTENEGKQCECACMCTLFHVSPHLPAPLQDVNSVWCLLNCQYSNLCVHNVHPHRLGRVSVCVCAWVLNTTPAHLSPRHSLAFHFLSILTLKVTRSKREREREYCA